MSKVKDIDTLKKYGFDESEIIELQSLKKENAEQINEFKGEVKKYIDEEK